MFFLRCLLPSVLKVLAFLSALKIIAHDPAQDEPCCPRGALQRTADFRSSDTRIVTHRDFNDTEPSERGFQDHLHRPTVCGFFQRERAKHMCAPGAKRAKISDLHAV